MITTAHDHEDEVGYEKRARAGLIPFIINADGAIEYLMMVASDPKFGGPRPMISKGKIEDGETPIVAAVREAEEELGLAQRNIRGDIFEVFSGRQELFSGAYHLTVFGAEIQSRWDFDKWCDETDYTLWMTLEEFRVKGRRDHIKFVEAIEERIRR